MARVFALDVLRVPAAARGCGFWQPSRNPSWLEDSRLPRPAVAPLWWLRRAATHTYTHRILTGARAAFAEVCLCAAMAGSGAQLPAVQILCAPRKVFLYIPKRGYSDARNPVSRRSPLAS